MKNEKQLLWKLTDEYGRTENNTQWAPGVTHRASGAGAELCSDGFIHAHEGDELTGPYLALLLNPIHANFSKPRLWRAEGVVTKRDGQLKCGVKRLTMLHEVSIPNITTEQRVEFAIRVARLVFSEPLFVAWSGKWLDGSDRTAATAEAARAAAWAAEATAEAWEAEAAATAATAAAAASAASAARAARASAAASASAAAASAARAAVNLSEIIKQVFKL